MPKLFINSEENISVSHGKFEEQNMVLEPSISGVPRNFFFGGGVQQIQLRTGQNGDLGCGSPIVRGSGGICNLVQEILFHIVKLS